MPQETFVLCRQKNAFRLETPAEDGETRFVLVPKLNPGERLGPDPLVFLQGRLLPTECVTGLAENQDALVLHVDQVWLELGFPRPHEGDPVSVVFTRLHASVQVGQVGRPRHVM